MSDWNGRTAPDAAEIEAMARHAMTTLPPNSAKPRPRSPSASPNSPPRTCWTNCRSTTRST